MTRHEDAELMLRETIDELRAMIDEYEIDNTENGRFVVVDTTMVDTTTGEVLWCNDWNIRR